MMKSKTVIVAVVALFSMSLLASPVVTAVAGEKMETGTNMKEGGPNMPSDRPVPPIKSKQFPEGEGMNTGTNMKEGGPSMKSTRPVPPISSKKFPEHENMETGTNMKEGGPNMKMGK